MRRTYGLQCVENMSFFLMVSEELFARVSRSQTENLMMSTLQPLTASVGTILNLMFLFIVIKVPSMRTLTNAYLACLSISDIVFLVHTAVINFTAWCLSPFVDDLAFLRRPGCIFDSFIQKFSYFSSLFIVTLVSFDRFFAICRPLQHRKINGKKRTTRLIFACLVFSAMLTIPYTYTESNYWSTCMKYPEGTTGYPDVWGVCTAKPGIFYLKLSKNIKMWVEVLPFALCFTGNL